VLSELLFVMVVIIIYQNQLRHGVLNIEKNDLDQVLKDQGFENLVLTNTEYNNLTSLAQILEKFEEITEITEGDKYSTVSMVIPSIYLLKEHLKSFKDDKNLKNLVKKLNQIENRFAGILEMVDHPHEESDKVFNDKSYLIASFIDPLFKLERLESIDINQSKKDSLTSFTKHLIIAECQKMLATEKLNQSNGSSS